MFSFVKKILLTGKNDISTLQKSLYCIAKQALFAVQNRLFCIAKQWVLQRFDY